MSEEIKPDAGPEFYNTLVPSLSDNANIQDALRMYHYGTPDGSIPDDGANPIRSESMAAYLGSFQSQIDNFGIGSIYSSTEPDLTSEDNGYIWVDADSTALIFNDGIPTISFYQASEPTTGLVAGMLWVDTDNDGLYVYNGTSWDAISSSGGSSYVAGANSNLSLTGLGVDVSAASAGQFQFNPGTGLEYFGAALNITSGYTKNKIDLSIGAAVSSGAGQVILQRVINGNPLSTSTVAAFTYSNGNLQFSYTDLHGQSAGTNVAYILTNATSDAVTFSSASSSALQISVEEIA